MLAERRQTTSRILVSNMLPTPVIEEIQRSNRTSRDAGGKAEAPLAWKFPVVHLLQSDIVGFTKCVCMRGARGCGRQTSLPLQVCPHSPLPPPL